MIEETVKLIECTWSFWGRVESQIFNKLMTKGTDFEKTGNLNTGSVALCQRKHGVIDISKMIPQDCTIGVQIKNETAKNNLILLRNNIK